MLKKIRMSLLTMLLMVATIAQAQVTTSSMSGRVTDNEGEVIGATVMAIHEPTGTRYGAITNEKGVFSIQGMRVGGPYNVTVSYVGYNPMDFKNINLSLGETFTLNVKLKETTTQLNEVVVTGTSGVKSAAGGAAANFKQSQITSTPTIDRNIYDIAKMSPLVNVSKIGGMSVAGSNNRFNSFQIDGMVSNDVFGLAASGTNGGQTNSNPISLDAIQEIQVVISPFDVTQSGFTGGGINAITKSGTNKFRGSVYGYYTNQNMYGQWSQVNNEKSKLGKQVTQTYGFTLGGPIIQNKLFFFTNAEYKSNVYPSDYYPGYTAKYITEAEAKQIADRYQAITGNADSYAQRDVKTNGLSALARLDWNINDNNKFAFRYQYNKSFQDTYGAGARSYTFANSSYRMNNLTNSIVAELNSHFGRNIYNEARAGVTLVRDNRKVPYQSPNISIGKLGPDGGIGAYIGTEYSSGANKLNQDIYTIEDNLSIYKGDHTITVGMHNEIYSMYNLFIQASNGAYYYDSLNDFLNDNAYKFVYNYSDYDLTGSYQWGATVRAAQFGIYGQDKWLVNNNFTLTYGIRFDLPVFLNKPTANDAFNSSSYATNNNVRVGDVPSPKVMISPRLGFKYFTDDSHNTLLRGGLGLFTGRIPFVWISNNYGNTGVEMKGTTISKNVPSFEKYKNDPLAAMNSATGSASKPTINTVSKGFKFPQVFRANLALEQNLPGDVKMTLEGLYSKTLNSIWWENLALTDNGKKVYAVSAQYPDASAIYWSKDPGSYSDIVNLRNTSKGYSYSLSSKLEKSFNFGLDLMASYTYGHSYSINDGTSSVAYSNWKYKYAINPNDPNELSFSSFDVPHKVMAVVSYTTPKYLNNRMATVVSLTYNGSNGMRYSLTMNESKNDFNGDKYEGNSLMYIPTQDELAKMSFAKEEDRAKFGEWIENDSYAKNNRGKFAPRNSNLAPWENHFDLHLAQDFFYSNDKSQKVSLTFDIMNVGNLLNKNWGTSYGLAYNVTPLAVSAMTKDVNGNYTPTYKYLGYGPTISDFFSRWHGQVGLKVTF